MKKNTMGKGENEAENDDSDKAESWIEKLKEECE